ncbi:threonine-phosphate decarboxylase CobD [Aromatoleum petrolei]|uniref:threonine-phosphate decarboxylase n=1 Tax=Aromatoleum petrolei TaxID=76116 RepID=A0ABX1MS20_9RHOO|nr:threonine-phosphate decarboxylase CobD [Aromatoleum petrolei]NMF89446.1 threonine-phosphate decarboxylase [Aromatoleum petrolei]QTQ36207.1 Threonine-phosphate decarboxylase [Aromatoleum petrolei]
MLEHGGRLRRAAQHYGIPLADWLDLSTGINPHAWPVPPVPAAAWHRLPEDDDGLEAAAAAYYGTDQLLSVAGSQPAIQALPVLIPGERVTVLAPTYAEHPHAWRGRTLRAVDAEEIDAAIDDTDVLLLVHPNNPSGARFSRERLLGWHARLAARGGWLVVDEAFIDTEPAESLAGAAGRDRLVVLRSLGKFFGLAGARVGFILAPAALRERLADLLGPWTLSGPARHVARAALADRAWQDAMRARLQGEAARLATLLRRNGLGEPTGPALFQWVRRPDAQAVHDRLARAGILVRLFEEPASLRFGLPPDEAGWSRLAAALDSLRRPA